MFLDTVSQFPEVRAAKGNVIGVYIAWRGIDITLPVAKFLTFWSRKATGETIAAQNGCLATISELALAARAPDKQVHRCILLGHSFGGLVLVNYKVVRRGDTTAPPNLIAKDNRAVDANALVNHPDYSFYTSEHNDGHEDRFCVNGNC